MMNTETQARLKVQLLSQIEALGTQNALFPANGEAIDPLIEQLEQHNPIPCPLHPDALPQLMGHWQLIYASRGTVVTRRLTPFSLAPGTGITLERIWQTLAPDPEGTQTIAAENGADLKIPLLGDWRLRAEGKWCWQAEEGQVATVSFNAFAVQARQILGQAEWQFPELKVPVLDFLRNEAWWKTSYLDTELRVGRGRTGNLFMFRRHQPQTLTDPSSLQGK